jgi:cytochrome P450
MLWLVFSLFITIVFILVVFVVSLLLHQYSKYKTQVKRYSHIPGQCQFLVPKVIEILDSNTITRWILRNIIYSDKEFTDGTVCPKAGELHRVVLHLKNKYPSHRIYKIIWYPICMMVVNDAEYVKLIGKQGFRIADRKTPFVDSTQDLLGPSVFTTTDQNMWKRHRILMNPGFSEKAMEQVANDVVITMKEYMHLIDTSSSNNRDVLDDMSNVTFDVIGRNLCGMEFHSSDIKTEQDSIPRMLAYLITNWTFHAAIPKIIRNYVPSQKLKQFNAGFDLFIKRMKETVALRKQMSVKEREQHRDILNFLLDATSEENSLKPLSNEELVANIMFMFIAGHETTARSLTFTLYLLATHPHIQRKMQQIIDEQSDSWENDAPQLSDFSDQLKYIMYVIKESMRLHPVVLSGILRTLYKDVDWKGVLLPKGTFTIAAGFLFYRDPSFWINDPVDEFVPERWEYMEEKVRNAPHMYSVFGIGARNCIGKRFAEVEMAIFLAMIMSRYTVEMSDKNYGPMEYETHITNKPRKLLRMNFIKRERVN